MSDITGYEFINGYTGESMSESEVKTLKMAKVELSRSFPRVVLFPHKEVECHCYKCVPRAVSSVARIIAQDWKRVYFGAVPYLRAMQGIYSVNELYGFCEDGKTQVIYFMSNAGTYKGTIARFLKLELKHYAGMK